MGTVGKAHITESLRTLYKRFCREDEMTAERMEAMRDICYSYEVRTKVRGMKCVLVIEKDGSVRQRIRMIRRMELSLSV